MTTPPNQIAKLRKERGWTQHQLAEKLGVHWITVSKIERGRQRLTTEWMDRIAGVLGVGRWVLLGSTDELLKISVSGQLNPSGQISRVSEELPSSIPIYRWTLNHPDALWVIVGEGGYPPLFKKGDILEFFINSALPQHYIGRLCWVRGKDDRTYFGLVSRGSSEGLFDILVTGQPPIRNVEVVGIAQLTLAMFEQPIEAFGFDASDVVEKF